MKTITTKGALTMPTNTILTVVALAIQSCKTDEEKSALINDILKTAVGEGMKAGIPEWFSFYPDGLTMVPRGTEGHEDAEALHQAFQIGRFG